MLAACEDPKDPQTWIGKLRDPEHAPKAVRELEKLGDPVAIEPLCDLYRDFESPNILKAIIRLTEKDPDNKKAIETLISALEFTEDKYHNATKAADALADLDAKEAVEPLTNVLHRPMSIKSRANLAKLAAIKALGRLGDPKAVPDLIRVMERRPEEQDFLLNKQAAVALGQIGDARAVPVLIRGLFMSSTIQGTSYPQARVALVRIGPPGVPDLVKALKGEDKRLNMMAKELKFQDGVILGKIARVLGDMRAHKATEPLLKILAKADTGNDYTKGLDGVIEALAKIGDEEAVDPLIKILKSRRAHYKIRMQVCQAFTVMGSKKAIPVLLDVSEHGNIEGGYTNLREGAAMAYSRIVGAEVDKGVPKMKEMIADPKLKDFKATIGVFEEALDRMEVAQECKDDATCYGKKLGDQDLSLAQREKAGIMVGILENGREALPDLIEALPVREPVLRLFYLESAKRIGNAGDKKLIEVIEKLAKKDSKRKVKYLGADLASADKVALAVIKAQKPE
jgi:HEAT repeat protein